MDNQNAPTDPNSSFTTKGGYSNGKAETRH